LQITDFSPLKEIVSALGLSWMSAPTELE